MQKRKVKNYYLFLSSLLIGLFSFPFVFAKTVEKKSKRIVLTVIDPAANFSRFSPDVLAVYDSLNLDVSGLSRTAFAMAQKGFEKLRNQGALFCDSIISIIDFSRPSSEKRLYVLDVKNFHILFNTYVAHGRNSGKEFASSFSNHPSSYKSSLGFFITGETYSGKHGFSLKLDGQEKGINDNVARRAVVIHGADYVSESLVHRQGYMGRSLGCPAVSSKESYSIINTIKEGTCLFIYSPDQNYMSHSALIR